MRATSLSVVIPVYNSEGSLAEVVVRVASVLETRAVPFEIILVNDGSRDRSWAVIAQLTRERPEVLGIDLSRNYGQHNALLCGIRVARHDVIITMDDDLQHPPEEIPKLLAKLEEGYDVVYGAAEREPHGWWRGAGSRLTKGALGCVLGVQMGRGVSAFRAFRTSLREAFRDYRSPSVLVDVLLSWGTTRFTTIPVTHHPRRIGRSNYTWGRLMAHAVHLLTSFSTRPLRFATWVGFGSSVFGLLVLAWVIGNYLIRGTSQPGFPFLASIIAIFAGAQLFALGILGEYVGQIHRRLMDTPPYVVRAELVHRHEGWVAGAEVLRSPGSPSPGLPGLRSTSAPATHQSTSDAQGAEKKVLDIDKCQLKQKDAA